MFVVDAGAPAWPVGAALTVLSVVLLSIVAFIPCPDGLASVRTHGVLLALMVGWLRSSSAWPHEAATRRTLR